MQVIAIAGQKGGVGKTTSAVNIASVLATTGRRILLVDTDPQGSATWWANRMGEGMPFDIAADTDPAILARLRAIDAHYDLVLVDTPGNLSDEAVLAAVLDNADFAVLPIEPSALSIRPLTETLDRLIRPRNLPYRVLVNRANPRAAWADVLTLLDGLHLDRFRTAIRSYTAHERGPVTGTTATSYPPDRYSAQAAHDMHAVALELLAALPADPANR